MDVLLDTHALFWSIYDTRHLSAEAVAALDDDCNTVWATLTSAQEIATKISVGRWPAAIDLLLNFEQRLAKSDYRLLAPVAADYANQLMLPDLPGHRDLYDKLIVAQALARKMTLVTSDSAVAAYDVPVIYAGHAPRAPERRGERLIPVQTLTPIALPLAPPPD
jgi:PIN domain nuclease of toxin-antitoxin system